MPNAMAQRHRRSRCPLEPMLGGCMAMSSASDQPEQEVDNAHNPANWIGQNQDSPPHRMSTGAADAAKRAQHEHGTNSNCYQNEYQNPVEK